MKIYNKKRLITGLVCIGLGFFSCINYLTFPSVILALQVKHLVISILLILIGINYVIRAFSKKEAEKDNVEKNIRNCIIKAKSNAISFIVLQRILLFGVILSSIAFYFTENLFIVIILITIGLLLSISLIIEFITTIYYSKNQQGKEF